MEIQKSVYLEAKRKQQLESIVQGIHNYLNSTESRPLIDGHGQKVWYCGGKAPWDALAKWEAKLSEIDNTL